MIIDAETYLAHYGTPRHSGRYPWGSTNNVPHPEGFEAPPRNASFLDTVEHLRRQGLSDTEIARGFGMTTTQYRAIKSHARAQAKQEQIREAKRLKEKGYSNSAIGRRMNLNESSVRALLSEHTADKAHILDSTAQMLRDSVAAKKLVDVGIGVERHIGVSKEKLGAAVTMLKNEGYKLYYIQVPQLGTGQKTSLKVLAPPDMTYSEAYQARADIRLPFGQSEDGGRTYYGILPPKSISSRRVQVRYAEDGGSEADGVIYVRPGVKDISLGGSNYAQVRVMVDGTHYLKGMAMYKDDMPEGVDIIFNTNKSYTGKKHDAFKTIKDDPDNPFGAVIDQIGEKDASGKLTKVTSAMNIVNEEGDWGKWGKTLSSQMLSKQRPSLAKAQLEEASAARQAEFDEIMALTNPSVRRVLLEAFADNADSAAVHLKAAALPKTATHVILPIASMKETEIYAPNYNDGDRVVLIRHPHGGIFEIPELVVNNRNREAIKTLGRAKDAVGINAAVAQRLSGADFDGDTVLVIPNNHGKVKTAPALEGLKGFDPIAMYKVDSDIPTMDARTKGVQMGIVSNLITDMTIKGAPPADIARAVRHSMVVIDAEKHNLDWKASARDNNISQLQQKYQDKAGGGASTLISRAGATSRIPERKLRLASEGGPVDKKSGKRIFVPTGATRVMKDGRTVEVTTEVERLALTDDARSLVSSGGGTKIEHIYADHSNKLKRMAERARLEALNAKPIPHSDSARQAYSHEVASLEAKLNLALRNAPLERQAQVLANAVVSQKVKAHPDMEKVTLKKIKSQALNEMRARVGAKKTRIEITKHEWDAIQAGAIRKTKLDQILTHADLDQVRQHATPRRPHKMTSAKISRARQLLAAGYTQAQVAKDLGVSLTTLKEGIK